MTIRQKILLNFICSRPKLDILENEVEEDSQTSNKPETIDIGTLIITFDKDVYDIGQRLNKNVRHEKLKYQCLTSKWIPDVTYKLPIIGKRNLKFY